VLAVVAAIFTLRAIDRERNQWLELNSREPEHFSDGSAAVPAIQFFPFEHSAPIQEALTLQWPALLATNTLAPVASLTYYRRDPAPLTPRSYLLFTFAVAIYWFLIGLWFDTRLLKGPIRRHAAMARFALTAGAACAVPFFLLFLGKDITGGWQDSPKGVYGFTAWLGLVCLILLAELRAFRRTA